MTVQEYIANQTVRMAESMVHFVESTPPDRLTLAPTVEGAAPTRTPLEWVGECVTVNGLIANVLRGEPVQSAEPKIENAADARRLLTESAAELANAIRSLTDDDLEREFQHPRGRMLGQNVIMMPMRNMAYHSGQINLVQILAGDPEFHVPPNWR
jgi:hypothetical protein